MWLNPMLFNASRLELDRVTVYAALEPVSKDRVRLQVISHTRDPISVQVVCASLPSPASGMM